MRKLPNFAGAEKLSLMDLQALADAVEAQERVLPPAVLPNRLGARKYGLANFNLDTANSCDGSAWPDNEGTIRSVAFSVADEPYICQGDIAIPLAHYMPSGGDDAPSAVGALASVVVEPGLTAPDIQRGQVRLPLADSACGGSVAGLVQGVQLDSTSGAYITAGVLHLPASGGGEDDCCGGCACVPAQYTPGGDECSGSVLGLICSVDPNDNILLPDIVDGAIRIPYADTARGAVGIMRGVSVEAGFTDPLICCGYLFLPLADTCNGATGLIKGVEVDATEPYISAGVLHLPLAGGGSCSCVPAEYTRGGTSTLGLIKSIAPSSDISAADIVSGAIRIPYADSIYCGGTVGLVSGIEYDSTLTEPKIFQGKIQLPTASGGLAGLVTEAGNMTWSEIECVGLVTLANGAGSTICRVEASVTSGYLNLFVYPTT